MKEILDDFNKDLNQGKVRHSCLTACLIFGIIMNSITGFGYIVFSEVILGETTEGRASWMTMTLAAIGFINVISCILLFKWKKIGFWIFIATGFAILGINLMMGSNMIQCGLGLGGALLLYVILQIKEKNLTAWEQMD